VGGTIVFFPTSSDGTLSPTSSSPDLEFPFPYEPHGPNAERQKAPHLHQVLQSRDGRIFAADLGSDRVWVVKRVGVDGLEILGWLQLPEGAGPRHCVLSHDGTCILSCVSPFLGHGSGADLAEKHLYVLTELTHALFVFSLDDPSYPAHPLPDFSINIVPPSVPSTHQRYMDSAEIRLNPSIPNVIYASNRWELHIKEKNPELSELQKKPSGDAVAIVLLSEDGAQVEGIKHLVTGCDVIRAMRVSPDGKFVAVAGQEGGGVEIWSVGGGRGDEWKLAAKEEGLKGVTDLIWL
jgi:6-phosphogluconolactonase (cycloisomerase 2 family)